MSDERKEEEQQDEEISSNFSDHRSASLRSNPNFDSEEKALEEVFPKAVAQEEVAVAQVVQRPLPFDERWTDPDSDSDSNSDSEEEIVQETDDEQAEEEKEESQEATAPKEDWDKGIEVLIDVFSQPANQKDRLRENDFLQAMQEGMGQYADKSAFKMTPEQLARITTCPSPDLLVNLNKLVSFGIVDANTILEQICANATQEEDTEKQQQALEFLIKLKTPHPRSPLEMALTDFQLEEKSETPAGIILNLEQDSKEKTKLIKTLFSTHFSSKIIRGYFYQNYAQLLDKDFLIQTIRAKKEILKTKEWIDMLREIELFGECLDANAILLILEAALASGKSNSVLPAHKTYAPNHQSIADQIQKKTEGIKEKALAEFNKTSKVIGGLVFVLGMILGPSLEAFISNTGVWGLLPFPGTLSGAATLVVIAVLAYGCYKTYQWASSKLDKLKGAAFSKKLPFVMVSALTGLIIPLSIPVILTILALSYQSSILAIGLLTAGPLGILIALGISVVAAIIFFAVRARIENTYDAHQVMGENLMGKLKGLESEQQRKQQGKKTEYFNDIFDVLNTSLNMKDDMIPGLFMQKFQVLLDKGQWGPAWDILKLAFEKNSERSDELIEKMGIAAATIKDKPKFNRITHHTLEQMIETDGLKNAASLLQRLEKLLAHGIGKADTLLVSIDQMAGEGKKGAQALQEQLQRSMKENRHGQLMQAFVPQMEKTIPVLKADLLNPEINISTEDFVEKFKIILRIQDWDSAADIIAAVSSRASDKKNTMLVTLLVDVMYGTQEQMQEKPEIKMHPDHVRNIVSAWGFPGENVSSASNLSLLKNLSKLVDCGICSANDILSDIYTRAEQGSKQALVLLILLKENLQVSNTSLKKALDGFDHSSLLLPIINKINQSEALTEDEIEYARELLIQNISTSSVREFFYKNRAIVNIDIFNAARETGDNRIIMENVYVITQTERWMDTLVEILRSIKNAQDQHNGNSEEERLLKEKYFPLILFCLSDKSDVLEDVNYIASRLQRIFGKTFDTSDIFELHSFLREEFTRAVEENNILYAKNLMVVLGADCASLVLPAENDPHQTSALKIALDNMLNDPENSKKVEMLAWLMRATGDKGADFVREYCTKDANRNTASIQKLLLNHYFGFPDADNEHLIEEKIKALPPEEQGVFRRVLGEIVSLGPDQVLANLSQADLKDPASKELVASLKNNRCVHPHLKTVLTLQDMATFRADHLPVIVRYKKRHRMTWNILGDYTAPVAYVHPAGEFARFMQTKKDFNKRADRIVESMQKALGQGVHIFDLQELCSDEAHERNGGLGISPTMLLNKLNNQNNGGWIMRTLEGQNTATFVYTPAMVKNEYFLESDHEIHRLIEQAIKDAGGFSDANIQPTVLQKDDKDKSLEIGINVYLVHHDDPKVREEEAAKVFAAIKKVAREKNLTISALYTIGDHNLRFANLPTAVVPPGFSDVMGNGTYTSHDATDGSLEDRYPKDPEETKIRARSGIPFDPVAGTLISKDELRGKIGPGQYRTTVSQVVKRGEKTYALKSLACELSRVAAPDVDVDVRVAHQTNSHAQNDRIVIWTTHPIRGFERLKTQPIIGERTRKGNTVVNPMNVENGYFYTLDISTNSVHAELFDRMFKHALTEKEEAAARAVRVAEAKAEARIKALLFAGHPEAPALESENVFFDEEEAEVETNELLDDAVEKGNVAVVRHFLQDEQNMPNMPTVIAQLRLAVVANQPKILIELLSACKERRWDVSKDIPGLLIAALAEGYIDCAKLLIEGSNPIQGIIPAHAWRVDEILSKENETIELFLSHCSDALREKLFAKRPKLFLKQHDKYYTYLLQRLEKYCELERKNEFSISSPEELEASILTLGGIGATLKIVASPENIIRIEKILGRDALNEIRGLFPPIKIIKIKCAELPEKGDVFISYDPVTHKLIPDPNLRNLQNRYKQIIEEINSSGNMSSEQANELQKIIELQKRILRLEEALGIKTTYEKIRIQLTGRPGDHDCSDKLYIIYDPIREVLEVDPSLLVVQADLEKRKKAFDNFKAGRTDRVSDTPASLAYFRSVTADTLVKGIQSKKPIPTVTVCDTQAQEVAEEKHDPGQLATIFFMQHDMFDCAQKLKQLYPDEHLMMLNAMNEHVLNGGAYLGAHAQEEMLIRMMLTLGLSSIKKAIEVFLQEGGSLYRDRGRVKHLPELRDTQAVFVENVPFLKDAIIPARCHFSHVEYRDRNPADPVLTMSIVGNASIPVGYPENTQRYEKTIKKRILAQCDAIKKHGGKNIVLTAFGCGAFHNDPALIGEWYAEKIVESGIDLADRRIVFAILPDGRNHAPEKFQEAFQKKYEELRGDKALQSDQIADQKFKDMQFAQAFVKSIKPDLSDEDRMVIVKQGLERMVIVKQGLVGGSDKPLSITPGIAHTLLPPPQQQPSGDMPAATTPHIAGAC